MKNELIHLNLALAWLWILLSFILVQAHVLQAHLIFAVPVVSLILGGMLTLTLIVHPSKVTGTANTISSVPPLQRSTTKSP